MMALMNWSEAYSVGVTAMDAQHQKWFGILNRLHEAMLAGKARGVQKAILDEMVAYTRTHFAQEEALLKTKGYPAIREHEQKHAAFAKKASQMQRDLARQGSLLSVEIMQSLKEWLSNHILREDTRYGAWLTGH